MDQHPVELLSVHLLECVSANGGYFADPGYKDVPGLIVLASSRKSNEHAALHQADGSGVRSLIRNCKEQILYEVQDPSLPFDSDVTADFSTTMLAELSG